MKDTGTHTQTKPLIFLDEYIWHVIIIEKLDLQDG